MFKKLKPTIFGHVFPKNDWLQNLTQNAPWLETVIRLAK